MPTAAQRAAIADYRVARKEYESQERDLVEALAAGDERRREQAETARETAIAALAAARARALGSGAGFDLLSTNHPLLLLPVRLETRFAWIDESTGKRSFAPTAGAIRSLLVRIYPDEIHDDPHEPELTEDERRLVAVLGKQLQQASDMRDLDEAWADAIRRVGPQRVGWLGEVIARGAIPGMRAGRLSRPSVARLLPDRWVALAELEDGSTLSEMSDSPVREPLETGPSPAGVDWMIDFDAALGAGMALVIGDVPGLEIRRLTVLGARGTLDPAASADELERLLEAQHYSRGASFLAHGTPTNSLPGTRAGYSSRAELEDVVPIERRRFLVGMRPSPLCQPGDGSDAALLAEALGIDASIFAYVGRADATDRQTAYDLRRLLATATRRRLTRQLEGIIDPAELAQWLEYAVYFVSPTGQFPALRIGNQPYGVLPVLVRDDDAGGAPDSLQARLLAVLDRLRGRWDQGVDQVPWVGDSSASPATTIVRILQRDAVARRIGFRPLLGPQLGEAAAAQLRNTARLDAERNAAAQAIDSLGAQNALAAPLLRALHLNFAAELTAPLVAPADAAAPSRQHPATYLGVAASLRPDRLLTHDYGGAERPRSLLYAIARLAMLETADEAAREMLIAAHENPARWDDEDVPAVFVDPLGTPLRRLEAPDPPNPHATVAFTLSTQGWNAYRLADMRAALDRLRAQPPELLEELLRSTLGLFGHRLDPWYTALAYEQLAHRVRADPASATGLNLGAYGIVEHLRPTPTRQSAGSALYTSALNGGYIHAPSVGQGAAASVLRSVHLAHHAAGHRDAFSVDLSSRRMRQGLELLEGIRAGQPLSALLGYRIERGLAAQGLQRLIAPLRGVAPLAANKLTPSSEPVESVAATNVVDGLTLLEEAGYDGANPPRAATLRVAHQSHAAADDSALEGILVAAADALDATADLAVAESVYQAVAGNPVRAGAAVDGLAGAPVPPPEIGLVSTPRTGVGVTHRLLVLLGDSSDDRGWPTTPRALAEPRLDGWVRAMLPSPERIGVRARFIDRNGKEAAALDDLTLASLHERLEDRPELPIGALDLVLLADPDREPQQSALEQRLAALLELRRPAEAAGAALELVYERDDNRDETTFSVGEVLEMARQLRDVISRARALAPEDLEPLSGGQPRALDPAELAGRAQGAEGALAGAIAALQAVIKSKDTDAIRAALFRADALGVAGAAPATVSDTRGDAEEARRARELEAAALRAQAEASLAELRRRDQALSGLAPDASLERLRAVLGESIPVLPAFAPAAPGGDPFDSGTTPKGATEAAARTWLSRAAPVRANVAALDAVLGYAEAVGAVDSEAPATALHVGQRGGPPGERWVGLAPDPGELVAGGRVSLVALTAGDEPAALATAGLFVDEWVEVIPRAEETTSVAFHYDAPTACAPQVLLLGVPPAGLEAWGAPEALQIVEEAHALARIRLVDLDDVPELGQLLPAMISDENPAGDAIGLDVETLTAEAP